MKRLAIALTLAVALAQPSFARTPAQDRELAALILAAAYCLVLEGAYTEDYMAVLVAGRYRQEGITYLLGAPQVAARAQQIVLNTRCNYDWR